MGDIQPKLTQMHVKQQLAMLDYMRARHGKARPADSPASFLTYARRGRWHLAPHLAYLNNRIMDAARNGSKRIVVVMPPRHGKSEYISAGTAAWWVGTFPDQRVMLASYAADFAASWGRKARDLLEMYGPEVFGVQVSGESHASDRWAIRGRMGGMTTSGIGGGLTGMGAHLLLVDDPVKNAKEAMSRNKRDSDWDWFLSTAYTRLEPNATIVVIMTRWHEDDLVGRLLKDQTENWEVIWFPAIAMANDQLGRAEGQALWAERYNTTALGVIKKTVGSYWWSALYQGLPVPEGGAVFKRSFFRYAERMNGNYILNRGGTVELVPVDKCIRFQTVDLAVSTADGSDYTVVATWAQTPKKDLILLDIARERLEGPDQLGFIAQQRERHNAARIGIERTQYQLSMVQSAIRVGLPAVGLKADTNKFARALTIAARYEAGAVFHMKGDWLDDYERELLLFDKGEHDDQVDCAAYAATFLLQKGSGVTATVAGD